MFFFVGCTSEYGYCDVTETSLNPEQETLLGYTSQELFSFVATTGTHGLEWEDDSKTCLNYTIELDLDSAIEVDQIPVEGKASFGSNFLAVDPVDVDPDCRQYVSMSGIMTIATTNGDFDEEMPVDVESYVYETAIHQVFSFLL